jgi:hypothetical protein
MADAVAGVVTVTSTVLRLDAADAVAVICVGVVNHVRGGGAVPKSTAVTLVKFVPGDRHLRAAAVPPRQPPPPDPCRVVRTAPSWPA